MTKRNEIAVIGVGNYLMSDEGVGIHTIQYLQEFCWPENVELIDAGVPGASLLYMLENRKLSIIIDCADFKGKPGEVLVVDPEKLQKPDEEILSLHNSSLLGTLALAEGLEIELGPVMLICVQPKSLSFSHDLSEVVAHALPQIKEEIKKILEFV